MPKTNLLVISPPDPDVLRHLEPLRAANEVHISNDPAEAEQLAVAAEVIVLAGTASKSMRLPQIWQRAATASRPASPCPTRISTPAPSGRWTGCR